jgi:hypothetical protein
MDEILKLPQEEPIVGESFQHQEDVQFPKSSIGLFMKKKPM